MVPHQPELVILVRCYSVRPSCLIPISNTEIGCTKFRHPWQQLGSEKFLSCKWEIKGQVRVGFEPMLAWPLEYSTTHATNIVLINRTLHFNGSHQTASLTHIFIRATSPRWSASSAILSWRLYDDVTYDRNVDFHAGFTTRGRPGGSGWFETLQTSLQTLKNQVGRWTCAVKHLQV